MTEEKYYNLMENMDSNTGFKKLHNNWFDCFSYILKSFKVGYNENTIKSLFYNFDMQNWKSMHKQNTEYKKCTKKELIDHFCGECSYISDRTSYDRLFRTHWLFLTMFRKEIDKIKYPFLYKFKEL